MYKDLTRWIPLVFKIIDPLILALLLFNSALSPEEVYFDSIDIIFVLISDGFYSCRQQEDVLSWSFVIEFDLGLVFDLEEADRLPEFAVLISRFFIGEPVFIVAFVEFQKVFLSDMEPSGFIGSEDQTFKNWIDSLESFSGGYDHYTLYKHLFA